MNLQDLEYFKVIAGTKNSTIDSNILSVIQPALSKAISRLEEELEVLLLKPELKRGKYEAKSCYIKE